MRKRTKHELSWLTAISDAGSTPAASTNYKLFILNNIKSDSLKLSQNCAKLWYNSLYVVRLRAP